jgi:UTP--glucose-1-phosphate uridylyltransferase
MGAAIEKLDGATAIEVPKARFFPVKTTNELLMVRSDIFDLIDNFHLLSQVVQLPEVSLDERFYKIIADFDERFRVIPSLRQVTKLKIDGDWLFDRPSTLIGDVYLEDQGQQARFEKT